MRDFKKKKVIISSDSMFLLLMNIRARSRNALQINSKKHKGRSHSQLSPVKQTDLSVKTGKATEPG